MGWRRQRLPDLVLHVACSDCPVLFQRSSAGTSSHARGAIRDVVAVSVVEHEITVADASSACNRWESACPRV